MLPSNSQPTKSSGLLWGLNAVLLISGIAALFFLLTNAVPFVQAGWLKDFGKKTRYVRPMLISVLIFSTMMFLVWWKFRAVFEKTLCVKIWGSVSRLPLRVLVAVLFVIYAAIMTVVGFERHLALETRAFDLGIFAQAVWNTIHGDLFFSSIKENINLMGDHISPILFFTTPFYMIWQDPRTLVLLQAIASASSLIPLALIARDKLKNKSLVLIFLLMFFFYQPMRAALHEDFHPEVLAEPFLWWAFFFLDRGKIFRFLLCLAVAVTGKENFLGVAFMLGFYTFWFKKMRSLGIMVMAASVGLFIWETKWLVPHLTGAKYFYAGNYATIMADPVNGIVKKLFNFESLEYTFKVFLPFLFLPFSHFSTLILTFPVFFQNLISVNGAMRSFNYHYFTGLTPFLFISTIFALASLRDRFKWVRRHILPLGFLLLTVSLVRSGPSEYYAFWHIHSHRSPHTDMIREELATRIPPDAVVLTHNGLIPQLCDRKYIYQFNYNADPTKLEQAKHYGADYLIWDSGFWEPNSLSLEETLVQAQRAGYNTVIEKDGFYILTNREL